MTATLERPSNRKRNIHNALRGKFAYLNQLARDLKSRGVLNSVRQEGDATGAFNERANEEEQATLHVEAKKIVDTARAAKRGLTADESKRFDEIKSRIEALKDEAAREKWLQQQAPTPPVRQAIPTTGPNNDGASTIEHAYARVRVPATARAPLYIGQHGKPVFVGADARRDAFVAGTFYMASVFGHQASRDRLKAWGVPFVHQSMSEGTNSAGGYLVPDELAAAIIKNLQDYGQARKLVQVVRMLSDTLNHPKRTGGLTAYFVGENTAGTASDPTYANVQLVAKKLMAICKRSSEVNEDSVVDLGAELTDELSIAMGSTEDRVVFIGDGTGTDGSMTGIVPAVAAQAGSLVTGATGQTGFSTLTLATCRSAVSKVKRYQGGKLAWYISPVGKSELFDRLLDAGGGNSNQNLAEGAPPKFLGYPVYEITVMDSTLGANASKVVALFGDLRQAGVFGDRRQFTVGMSDQRYFEEDQIGIKGTERFAWNTHDVGDASNAGAIVGVKTSAT